MLFDVMFCVYIRCCGNGCLGLRFYSASLLNSVYGPDTSFTGVPGHGLRIINHSLVD